jgi:paraquat-inducible protein A
MPDVFLLGAAVGYSRVAANLTVTLEAGGVCLIGAGLLCMPSRVTLDRRAVWRAIAPERSPPAEGAAVISCEVCDLVLSADMEDSGCPRCGLRLAARKPDAIIRTTALVIAGLLLYFPANVYPMSTAMQLGSSTPHRIVDGIRELFQAGLWPLGILIFCTSIAIPLLKILGLGWLLFSIRRGSARRLVFKSRCYRFIDEIGRWSNVDVFTIAVFVPLMRFGSLVSAHADWGAVAFILVVVLTMLASRVFDPRMLWDAAAGGTR